MKIIFLNTWGGRIAEPLKKFFETHQDVDVFCLQEVWNNGSELVIDPGERTNLFTEIGEVLESYEKIFAPADDDGDYGLAIYYKKSLLLVNDGNIMIHDKEEYLPDLDITSPKRNLQYVTFQVEDYQKLTIANVHGLWTSQGKDDSEDRLLQSDKIINHFKLINHSYVLGGDFNLNPKTESIKKLENAGLRNLITENNIISTRTKYFKHYEKGTLFADYIFVSKGVDVEDFKVLPDEVSDHAPLYVKINV